MNYNYRRCERLNNSILINFTDENLNNFNNTLYGKKKPTLNEIDKNKN